MNIQFFSKKLLSEEDNELNTVKFSVYNIYLVNLLYSQFSSRLINKKTKQDANHGPFEMEKKDYDRFIDLALNNGFDVDEDIDENPTKDRIPTAAEPPVIFTINDERLDILFNEKFAGPGDDGKPKSSLDYVEDRGDTYYSMSKSDFNRVISFADAHGFDVDVDIDENPMGYDHDTLEEEGSTTSAVPGIPAKLGANLSGNPTRKAIYENYSRFRKETKTRSEAQQYHEAIKAAHKKIDEANKILEYSQRLKEEFPYQNTGMHETKSVTKKAIDKLKQKVADSYKKIKKLEL